MSQAPPPVEARPPLAREAHLRDYWRVIWQGRWTVAAVFAIVVGFVAAYTFMQTPIYRAAAIVEVQPQANRLAAGQDISGLGVAGYGWFAEEKYHNTQVEILRSREVARRAFEELKLAEHADFARASDPIGAFRARIEAIPRRETGLIEVSMTGRDAKQIAEWVNTVAGIYVSRNIERAEGNVARAIASIGDQMKSFESQFSNAQEARFDALRGSTIFSSEEQAEIIRERLKDYNSDLNKTEIELSRIRETLTRIREMQNDRADLMSIPELADDSNLKELYKNRLDLELELESAKVTLKPGHQQYKQTEVELAKVRQRIQDRVSTILGTLENKYRLTNEHASYLRREIHGAEDISVQVAQGKSDYELKKTKADATRLILDSINRTISEVQLGAQLMTNNVSILDSAVAPLHPIKPRKLMNLVVGCAMGLFFGVGAAFFLDYLDNTFRTPDDIEKYLGLSVLGVIPRIDTQGLAHRAVKESYQSLRTSVIFSSKNHRRKVILLTSTGPQEGKSSTAANLARMLAAAGDRVIVVDCDLRRPTQHAVFGVEREPGLTNHLAAPIDGAGARGADGFTEYVRTLAPGNLNLLTSGPIPPSPPELLGSERFAELVAELKERYDWVLVDSPPAASLADSTLLASIADMVVLVVRHARADRDLVGKTLQRLRAVNATVAGVVLNNVDLDRAYHKDYYYAGAYYYTEDGERRETRKGKVASRANVG